MIPDLDPAASLRALVVSAGLGALIGLVRQWEDQQGERGVASRAGIRTFTLWAMWGVACAVIQQAGVPGAWLGGVAAVILFTVVRMAVTQSSEEPLGLTTAVAGALTFGIGSLVAWGQVQLGVALAVLVVLLVALREVAHAWTRRLTREDLRTALQFAAVTGVILPLVPDRGFGPLEAFNPFTTWLMVVIISGLGFVGYGAMRWLGDRAGIALTGLVGGLASSTATTLAFSRRSREQPDLSSHCALAVLLACTVMLGRVAVLVGAFNAALLLKLWPALVAMAIPGLVFGLWVFIGDRNKTSSGTSAPTLSNPLGLGIAVKFALLYAVVVFLVKAVSVWQAGSGLLWVSMVSGLTDMDAIALSLAQTVTPAGNLELELGLQAMIVAAASNTFLKGVLAFSLGSPLLRKQVGGVLGATVAMAGVSLLWLGRTTMS
jgi:uncharacterized membrane protein (DUF4010 family)